MVHRINIFLLSIILVIAQFITMNQALAAGLNGWSLSNPIVQGASVAYNGVKNVLINGKNFVKTSSALITPNASQVAKVLVRGAGGYALSVAVADLIGDGVDWVLDPANNQIKYKVPGEGADIVALTAICKNLDWVKNNTDIIKVSSIRAVIESPTRFRCEAIFNYNNQYGNISVLDRPTVNDEEKTLPLDVVASQVISNATNGDSNAKSVISTAAADIVTEAETDDSKARPIVNQLEQNATTQTDADAEQATGQTKPNTTTGGSDISLKFPVFCGWAPIVCEAAQSAIQFPKTVTEWWNTGKTKAESWAQSISEAWATTKEWMTKDDTPEEKTEVDIDQTVPQVPNTSYFNWGAYCPFTPGSQTISLDNTSSGLDYDLTSWCELASELRPFVLAAGALMSFLIASGVIMGRDD